MLSSSEEPIVRKFLLSAAVVAGLVAGGAAQAGDHGRHAGMGHDRGPDHVRVDLHHDFDRHDSHMEHGVHFSHGTFFRGDRHPDWSFRCWSPRYHCYFFWYPDLACYYYWCAPQGCWYPISYVGVVPPGGEIPGMQAVPQTMPAGVPGPDTFLTGGAMPQGPAAGAPAGPAPTTPAAPVPPADLPK
jgi:hypothetical protein